MTIGLTGSELIWPLALSLAWAGGEFGARWLGLPRISSYGIVGFLLARPQLGVLPDPSGGPVALLADYAFALILFELGYRINLRWLRHNPWLGVTSIIESVASFLAVSTVVWRFGMALEPSLLLAALAMATSPAAIVRVANDLNSAGQVTERSLHLSALNCLLSVFTFKVIAGYWVFSSAGSLFQAIWASLVVMAVSVGLGVLFGVLFAGLLRQTANPAQSATIVFALAVLLLTALTTALKFSPLLAAITFGIMARHRRVVLSPAQRNFGVLGEVLTVLLFVFVAATLDWQRMKEGIDLALLVLVVRLASKTAVTTGFARLSGITWRKGLLTGLALTPQSVFVILLLEQSRHLGIGWINDMAGLATLVLLLEIGAPLVTRWALLRAGEAHPARRG
ncbi:MAG: cation:proton antiporter [Rhodocyclaceae bacterium]